MVIDRKFGEYFNNLEQECFIRHSFMEDLVGTKNNNVKLQLLGK